MTQPTLPHNTRRLEQDIVRTLLEKLAAAKTEYPPELYEPRRDAYLAQVKTQKCPGRCQSTRAVTDQSGTL
jgi:hypothetical protein